MRISSHGGACCGARHLHGFSQATYDLNTRRHVPASHTVEEINALCNPYGTESRGRSRGKYIEAIVTDYQLKSCPDLAQNLVDAGFKFVSRFYNSSGGMCNVLQRTSGGRDLVSSSRRLPFLRPFLEQ